LFVAALGGVPEILVPDNPKSGVKHASFYDPDLNPTYRDLANHYGVVVLPARPRKPKDKAKVEGGVLVPVLEKKPGALRNCAPFQDWTLPTAIGAVKDRLLRSPQGDLAFVEVLPAMRSHGVNLVTEACELALAQWSGVRSGDSQSCTPLTAPRQTRAGHRFHLAGVGHRAYRRLWALRQPARRCAMLAELTQRLKALHLYGMAAEPAEMDPKRVRKPDAPEVCLQRLVIPKQLQIVSNPI